MTLRCCVDSSNPPLPLRAFQRTCLAGLLACGRGGTGVPDAGSRWAIRLRHLPAARGSVCDTRSRRNTSR
jgi:hypothetical protein